jgi:hypothetical protein
MYAFRPTSVMARGEQREDKGGRVHYLAQRIGGQTLVNGWVGPRESARLGCDVRACAAFPPVHVVGQSMIEWVALLEMRLPQSR